MARRKKKAKGVRSGQILFEPSTGKFFEVRRISSISGPRFFLYSLESGNPGRMKVLGYIQNQIEDGFLVRLTRKQYEHETG